MNATEFVDDNSDAFSGNLSVQPTQRYNNSSEEPWSDFSMTDALVYIITRGAYALQWRINHDANDAMAWGPPLKGAPRAAV